MDHEPAACESESLAASLRTYLSQTGFAFTGMTAKEATPAITRAVADWAQASGWKCRWEEHMRYIDPPRAVGGGCRIYWWPSRSAYLDLQLLREDGPPIAVEIDREDIGTAVDKLRDEALRGRPALWIRWHGAVRAELPAGVARLRLPTRATRSPIRSPLKGVDDTAAITCGEAVSPEAREDALVRDRQRIAEERRTAALQRSYPPVIRC